MIEWRICKAQVVGLNPTVDSMGFFIELFPYKNVKQSVDFGSLDKRSDTYKARKSQVRETEQSVQQKTNIVNIQPSTKGQLLMVMAG